MDRLDSWLNSQAGWRRAVLIWLQMCPPVIMAGCAIWEAMTPALPPWPGLVLLEAVACSLAAAAPLAGLFALLLRSPAARYLGPALSWRRGIGTFLWMAAFLISQATVQKYYGLHHALSYANLILILGGGVLMIDAGRRSRRSSSGALPIGDR